MTKMLIDEYLIHQNDYLLIDVRSPGEHKKGNIPGSINIPLLNDEERKEIGTIYKQESKRAAIKRGLDFFGPKMRLIVDQIDLITHNTDLGQTPLQKIALYCWRGGMRSNIFGWLLNIYGYDIVIINGGYKSYRNWCINQFEKDYRFILIGGFTGTGKTNYITKLVKKQVPIIDLEKLAKHKGSAFGGIGMGEQPSQEMFENELAMLLFSFRDHGGFIIVEDESQRIGSVSIPQNLWEQMKKGYMVFISENFDIRLGNIINEYGKLDRSLIGAAVVRLQKKLGGLETKNCLGYLLNKDYVSCFSILLKYYDKLYTKSLENKRSLLSSYIELKLEDNRDNNIQKLYNTVKKILWT